MLDMNEIDQEIARLENEHMTYRTCEKLSVLYTVRGNRTPIQGKHQTGGYSYADAPKVPESPFLQAVEGKSMDKVLMILDEHMEAVKLLYPKEYNMIMQKIREA